MKGLILLVSVLAFSFGSEPVVTARVDRSSANLGDLVTLTLDLHFEQGWDFDLQPLEKNLGKAVVHSFEWSKPVQLPDTGLTRITLTASLAWYELGKQTIAPIHLKGSKNSEDQTFESKEIEIEIVPTLEEGDQNLSESKPQARMKELSLWLAGLLAVLLLLVVIWMIWRRFRPRHSDFVPELPPLPPFEEVNIRMKELIGSSILKEGNFKQFYIEISLIIRHFFGRVFQIPGDEMTSFELDEFFQTAQVPGEFLENQADFGGLCDRVKFAKYQPNEAENTEVVNLAYQLIRHLKPLCTEEGPHVEAR